MWKEHLDQRSRQTALMVFLGFLVLLRFALSSRLPSYILAGTPHDDGWVVGHALTIFKGEWLGPYDQYTLIKGAFSPLLMAFAARVGVTYSGLNTVLYCFACLVFVASIRPLVKRNWVLVLVFAVLLFNPLSYAMETGQRIYRNGIGQWEILLVFGGLVAILLRRNDSVKSLLKWVLASGLALGAFLQTREDSTWIIPFVVGMAVSTVFIYLLEKKGPKIKAAVFLLPVLIAVLSNAALALANHITYGAPVLNDRNGGNYAKVAGDLYAITPNADDDVLYRSDAYRGYYYNIYVSTMEKAFHASPTLNSASSQIRDAIKMWASWEEVKTGQLSTDHMLFALRDGVSGAGYYKSLPETEKFYGKVHEELQTAFDRGELVKHGFPVSPLMKRLQSGDLGKAISLMPKAIRDIAAFSGVSSVDFPAVGSPDGVRQFVFMAGGEYRDDKERLVGNGWAFAKNDKTRLSISLHDERGAHLANIPLQAAPDVYAYVKERGLEYRNAKTSRFSFDVEGVGLKNGAVLRFSDEHGDVFREIILNGSTTHGEDDSFLYHIDNLKDLANESMYSRLVKRANRVIGVYQKFFPFLSVLACVVYFFATFSLIGEVARKQVLETLPVWLVLTGIASSFMLFMFGMCLITATSFNSLHYLYTAPAYILLLMFCGVSLFWSAENIFAFKKRGTL